MSKGSGRTSSDPSTLAETVAVTETALAVGTPKGVEGVALWLRPVFYATAPTTAALAAVAIGAARRVARVAPPWKLLAATTPFGTAFAETSVGASGRVVGIALVPSPLHTYASVPAALAGRPLGAGFGIPRPAFVTARFLAEAAGETAFAGRPGRTGPRVVGVTLLCARFFTDTPSPTAFAGHPVGASLGVPRRALVATALFAEATGPPAFAGHPLRAGVGITGAAFVLALLFAETALVGARAGRTTRAIARARWVALLGLDTGTTAPVTLAGHAVRAAARVPGNAIALFGLAGTASIVAATELTIRASPRVIGIALGRDFDAPATIFPGALAEIPLGTAFFVPGETPGCRLTGALTVPVTGAVFVERTGFGIAWVAAYRLLDAETAIPSALADLTDRATANLGVADHILFFAETAVFVVANALVALFTARGIVGAAPRGRLLAPALLEITDTVASVGTGFRQPRIALWVGVAVSVAVHIAVTVHVAIAVHIAVAVHVAVAVPIAVAVHITVTVHIAIDVAITVTIGVRRALRRRAAHPPRKQESKAKKHYGCRDSRHRLLQLSYPNLSVWYQRIVDLLSFWSCIDMSKVDVRSIERRTSWEEKRRATK